MKRLAKKLTLEVAHASGRYLVPPEFLSLITTWHCNFHCQSCSVWEKTNFQELNLEQWLPIILDLKTNLPATTFVEINGGEPLLNKNLVLELIKELKSSFKTVALNTNGSLINEEIIKELEVAGLDILKLSFYSLDPTVHNKLRGDERAYDQAKKTIDLLQDKSIKLEIGILLTSQNISGLPELITWLETLPNITIVLQPLDEKVESSESKNFQTNQLLSNLWPNRNQSEIFFNWLATRNNLKIKNSPHRLSMIRRYYLEPSSIMDYRCFAGQRNLVVYPNGGVALCFKRGIIGNLSQTTLNTLLKSQTTKDERRKIQHCQKYCRIIGCNFSRGLKEIFLK
jgi:MoaA/NifB/PqqE/SkfB family radical SAM enzyme